MLYLHLLSLFQRHSDSFCSVYLSNTCQRMTNHCVPVWTISRFPANFICVCHNFLLCGTFVILTIAFSFPLRRTNATVHWKLFKLAASALLVNLTISPITKTYSSAERDMSFRSYYFGNQYTLRSLHDPNSVNGIPSLDTRLFLW